MTFWAAACVCTTFWVSAKIKEGKVYCTVKIITATLTNKEQPYFYRGQYITKLR